MRVPLSWLREYVELPADVTARAVADRLTAAGLQVERVEAVGHDVDGVVVAKVLTVEELPEFKKPVRWVSITDGSEERWVICGATNFAAGDVVAYARPPARLPGGLQIGARKTYGHVSDGMLCSPRELGLSEEGAGILVLDSEPPLGSDVVDVLQLRDDVLDISLNPDRGYALSVRGVAREAATAFGVAFRDPAAVDLPDAGQSDAEQSNAGQSNAGQPAYPVRIEDPTGCDRYVAMMVADVDPGAGSPAWLQRRLILCGMRPVSLAVDVTNHVMLELGQPMHAFDRSRLSGPLVVRRAVAGERLRTLDNLERILDPRDLVIADDSGPVALAGVMGGAATEIRDSTREIVLESAHFDPVSVGTAARRHRLGSEASRRFERGVDDALAPYAGDLAVRLLQQLGGATALPGTTDVDRRPPPITIRCDAQLPGRLAGVHYPTETVVARLRDVGCTVGDERPVLTVTVPSWRPDLRRPVDLVEEVVRLEGYDTLPATVPAAPAGQGLTRRQRLTRQVGRVLADIGYVEVMSLPFLAADSGDRLLLDADDPRRPSVRVANPVSEEEPYLRATLLPGLFDTVARNLGRGLPDIALFETGSVFRSRPGMGAAPRPPAGARPDPAELAAIDAALPDQPARLAVVLTGHRERPGWWGPGRLGGWADAIAAVRRVAETLGVELAVTRDDHPPFHPGRCARLQVGPILLGHAGELQPRVVEQFDLPERTCAAEIALDVLLDAAPELSRAPVMSAYPAATIDVALVVDERVPAADVTEALRAGAGELLEAIRLFDRYAGPQLGAGRKSLAFTLRLRAPDRTLTSEETTGLRDAAVAEASRRCGAELRTA